MRYAETIFTDNEYLYENKSMRDDNELMVRAQYDVP